MCFFFLTSPLSSMLPRQLICSLLLTNLSLTEHCTIRCRQSLCSLTITGNTQTFFFFSLFVFSMLIINYLNSNFCKLVLTIWTSLDLICSVAGLLWVWQCSQTRKDGKTDIRTKCPAWKKGSNNFLDVK